MKKFFNNLLLACLFVLTFVFIGEFICSVFKQNVTIKTCTVIFSILSGIVFIIFYKNASFKLTGKQFGLFLLLLTIAFRLAWIMTTNIPPISDFDLYHKIAIEIMNGKVLQSSYIALFPHVLGLPAVLSVLYKVFGVHIIVAQLLNVASACMISIIIWKISAHILPERGARMSAVLCAVWPSQIFFSTIIANEALFTLLFVLCIYLIIKSGKIKNFILQIGLIVFIGFLAALANAIRPMLVIFLVASVFYISWIKMDIKHCIYKKAALILVLIVSFSIFGSVNSGIVEKIIGQTPAKNSFGYTFLVGANIESKAFWNEEDINYMFKLYDSGQYTLSEINDILIDAAFKRITSNVPRSIVHYITKQAGIWSTDDYGVMWNKLSVETAKQGDWNAQYEVFFVLLSNAFYQAMIIISMLGLAINLKKKNANSELSFIILIILGFVGANTLSEVQCRYHYTVLPMLAICASFGVHNIVEYIKDEILKKNKNIIK